MYTENSPIEEPENDWQYETYSFSNYNDDPDDEEDDEEEEEDVHKDWGEIDPTDSPNQPWTGMDPTGPGSAV
ncbi:hypothetical protein [Flavobacterium silvaticum]|uniref:Uncharacterized protein n=1 Tax=Flavobacterium silvaticum TaxID=1852020 RepID=A0A972FJ04_9FLAO|nr:hypothetical protein [Flavobacterium silvaticum]NMH26643.1 hypothetical protein [Flavobacterium silvaticum]